MVSKATLVCAMLGVALASPNILAQERPERPKPGVLFTGTSLPTPPQQGKPWKPPACKLSEKWISAAKELYRCGFADPRGCEYREVKITTGSSAWGGDGLVTTHAWVIPKQPGEKADSPRFAVTWDGLVYPVAEAGPQADFKADVEAMLAADDTWWKGSVEDSEKKTKENPKFAFAYRPYRWTRAWSEDTLVSFQSLLPLKSCVVFRLGEGALAERILNAWKRGVRTGEGREAPADDPNLLAREWGWALFDRAVGAHKRGDDVIAMVSAKTLIAQQEAATNVRFEDSPERLLEDATRRVRTGPVQRVLDVGLAKFPDQSKRIAALVRDLEVASVEQMSQPGGVTISESPIVQALIKEGPPAIEPLLRCLANDRRLTRSVSFGRDFFPQRHFIGVDRAAFVALRGILNAHSFGPRTENGYDGGGTEAAEEIRRYWEKNKGLSKQETWFNVLADAQATPEQWLDAAERIVEPGRANQATDRSQIEGAITINGRLRVLENDRDLGQPLAGESLRGRNNPSVAELMARKADEIANVARLQHQFSDMREACELTLSLAKWDRQAAVPVIRRRIADCRDAHGSELKHLAAAVARLMEASLQAGDDKASDRYIAWLRSMSPRDFDFFETIVFLPLWRHPENPKLAELARWAFLAEDSPWHPLHELKPVNSDEIITSPLVGVPAFRQLLKREFTNNLSIGDFQVGRDSLSMDVMHASMGRTLWYVPDMEVPKPEVKQTLRACDFYATEMSRLEGAPRYELYWPEKRRDAVRIEMAKFLDQWGNCFRDRSKLLEAEWDVFSTLRFQLSRLPRPATPKDVTEGRAIFSLRDRGDAQVQIVALTPYPSMARWKTLKQFPLLLPQPSEYAKSNKPEDLEKAKHVPWESFDREGYVWQAEEVLIDGKWHHYYGFVGNHIIAKVPAEEIEFIDQFSPAHPHR